MAHFKVKWFYCTKVKMAHLNVKWLYSIIMLFAYCSPRVIVVNPKAKWHSCINIYSSGLGHVRTWGTPYPHMLSWTPWLSLLNGSTTRTVSSSEKLSWEKRQYIMLNILSNRCEYEYSPQWKFSAAQEAFMISLHIGQTSPRLRP